MAFPIRSKRGFYLITPFLGVSLFITVIGVAAYINNENAQLLEVVGPPKIIEDLIFSAKVVEADVFDVYLHNKLQTYIDYYEPCPGCYLPGLRDIFDNTLDTGIGLLYMRILEEQYHVDCKKTVPPTTLPTYLTHINHRTYQCDGIKFFDYLWLDDMWATEIKPDVSGYGVKCRHDELTTSVGIEFISRYYFLDGEYICDPDIGVRPNSCCH